MEHTDSFTFRLLLVAKDETSAKELNHHFTKAGLVSMDVETGINNVIPKITKDSGYDGIVLEAGAVGDVPMYVGKLRANRNGKQLPVVVIDPEQTVWLDVTRAYDAGANFVITSPVDEDVANHVCWVMNSMLLFVDQYKQTVERFFRR